MCIHWATVFILIIIMQDTVGRVSITWFNDCILGKLGQIANPQWSTLYHIIVYAHVYVCKSINCEHRKYSQFAINGYLQLKPTYGMINE